MIPATHQILFCDDIVDDQPQLCIVLCVSGDLLQSGLRHGERQPPTKQECVLADPDKKERKKMAAYPNGVEFLRVIFRAETVHDLLRRPAILRSHGSIRKAFRDPRT